MPFLYSASLETHMKKYLEDVQLQDLNDQYHQTQLQLLKQAQLLGLTPDELLNKIDGIPKFNTDAPELNLKEEKYSPPTASQYENAIRNKKATPTGTLARSVLDELKQGKKLKPTPTQEKIKTVSPFQAELTEKVKSYADVAKSRSRLDSTQSTATTASTSGSPQAPLSPNLHIATQTKQLKQLYKEKGLKWTYSKGNLSQRQINEAMSKLAGSRLQGSGLRRTRKLIKKKY